MSSEKKQKRYDMGQILYVVPDGKNVIIPIMIVEEVVKKTAKSEDINYRVQAGADENKTLMISDIKGEIFQNIREMQKELFSRAQKSIAALISSAEVKSKEWFKSEIETDTSVEKTEQSAVVDDETPEENFVKVNLPDGRTARVKMK